MSWMDVRNYYTDYEEPEPTKQPHCPHCGRFLPWQPNGQIFKSEPNGHWDYTSEHWITDGPDFICPMEETWDCKCGSRWEISDLFK